MKAIETQYKGYRFRSRLEARWAVFFDALGIEWEYEKEGYEFEDGSRYLPDFWLPQSKLWVEIKGQRPTKDELEKAEKLISGSDDVNDLYDLAVVVADGEPFYGNLNVFCYDSTDSSGGHQWWSSHDGERIFWNPMKVDDSGFYEGLFIGIEVRGSRSFSAFGIWSNYWHELNDKHYRFQMFEDDGPGPHGIDWIIRQSANKARSARFEHGETPVIK